MFTFVIHMITFANIRNNHANVQRAGREIMRCKDQPVAEGHFMTQLIDLQCVDGGMAQAPVSTWQASSRSSSVSRKMALRFSSS